MRYHFPDIAPATAFPLFILTYINPWFGGVILATLLLVVIGSGAGLALAIGTILTNDIFKKHIKPDATNKQLLAVSRIMIIVILVTTLVIASGNVKSSILGWSILSMGLRGSAAFLPLIAALFLKGRIYQPAGIAAIFMGPATVLGWHLFMPKSHVEPLFVGIMVGLVCILVGFLKGKDKTSLNVGK